MTSPGGKIKKNICVPPDQKVNKAEELTCLSINIWKN
jgi:hypothetical protein